VPTLVLGPLLRHVSHTTATFWVETDVACSVEVRLVDLGRSATSPTFCVRGHHYGLVMIEDLEPATVSEYVVELDGEQCWPSAQSTLPPSVLRTLGGPEALRVLLGSCRAAAPHEPPWSLEPAIGTEGRGVDALRTHALRMVEQAPAEWPHLFVLVGDQIYADDTSPGTRERIEQHRDSSLPSEMVADFEEYTWLYHEAWTPEVERWALANVPSVMMFDDHDMIDDWNISAAWVRDIREEPWWNEHVIGGLVSYWIYQHLGNLSPDEIRSEGMLEKLHACDDGETYLREWARSSEEFTPTPGGYRFSVYRDLGRTRLVVIDSRNGRVLEAGHRAMLDDDEWAWVVERATVPCDHLMLATSLPVFVPGGLHDLQAWNEAVCDGAWGRGAARAGERLRRSLDMEDWPAFRRSFDAFVELLVDVGTGRNASTGIEPPATITVLSGDIHFSYRAQLTVPSNPPMQTRVHQVVSSPIRNALTEPQRRAMRFGASRAGEAVARALRRAARLPPSPVQIDLENGPVFGNCMAELTFSGRSCRLRVERAHSDEEGRPLLDMVSDVEL
jgi:hypothetical protein